MIAPLDPLPGDLLWRRLTHGRRTLFEADLYFREGWADWLTAAGEGGVDEVCALALLALKPDAVVGRRMSAVLDFVAANGFRVVAARPLVFTRHIMRELWRYDWRVYPVDRLAFSTLWYTAGPAMFLMLEDMTAAPGRATARLAAMKGVALAAERRPTDLRSRLQPPNGVLNFVHVADESADLIREIAIFLDRGARRALLQALTVQARSDAMPAARALVSALEATSPVHDLDALASVGRLEASGALARPAASRLRQALHGGEILSWDELCILAAPLDEPLVAPSAPPLDKPQAHGAARWDFIAIASRLIRTERLPAAAGPGLISMRTVGG